MFSSELTNFLKSVSKISNSIILRSPVTYGKSEVNDISFSFNLTSVSEDENDTFDGDIGLFNLNGFLNVLGLFGENSDDRDVVIENNCINISNEHSKARYLMTAPQLLSAFEFKPEQMDIVDSKPSVAEFVLTQDDIKKLRSASAALDELKFIEFKGEDGVEISLSSVGKFNASSNTYTLKKTCDTHKNFDILISLETFMRIPLHDYTVCVKYNEARDEFRILMKSNNVKSFRLQVTVKPKQ